MGLLDDVMGSVRRRERRRSNRVTHSLARELLGMLAADGHVRRAWRTSSTSFNQKGLGDIVNSWISTGQNLPISAEQIQAVLGSSQVQALAARGGHRPAGGEAAIAQILPHLVDKATPNGQIPAAGGLLSVISGIFRRT